jgi:hypothetical protein
MSFEIHKNVCDICGLLFNTVHIMEEHKKLEHIEHKPATGVG